MIRNTMLALSLFTFTAGSAFAAAPKHHAATRTVAEAPAGEAAAPADKPAKKEKKAKKEKADKGAKDASKTEMKAATPETK
jgi:hypothetical protein